MNKRVIGLVKAMDKPYRGAIVYKRPTRKGAKGIAEWILNYNDKHYRTPYVYIHLFNTYALDPTIHIVLNPRDGKIRFLSKENLGSALKLSEKHLLLEKIVR